MKNLFTNLHLSLSIISFSLIIFSCTNNNVEFKTVNKPEKSIIKKNSAEKTKSLLAWDVIKNKFPYENILEYDFTSDGVIKNDLSKIVELDSVTFQELVNQVKQYSDWKDYLKIYYFSKNRIANHVVGVFFVKKEFEGEDYTFDLIWIDNKGKVKNVETLARRWIEVECIGYTRAKIDTASNTVFQEVIRKCYDEEAPNKEFIDSIINVVSMENLEFNLIKTDTVFNRKKL